MADKKLHVAILYEEVNMNWYPLGCLLMNKFILLVQIPCKFPLFVSTLKYPWKLCTMGMLDIVVVFFAFKRMPKNQYRVYFLKAFKQCTLLSIGRNCRNILETFCYIVYI